MSDKEIFNEAVEFILRWEGFISDDINDPGKLTIYGIASKWHPDEVAEMKRLIDEGKKDEALEIAKDIYYNDYWLKADCDHYFFPANYLMFDTAVNMGISRANDFFAISENWQDYLLNRIDYYKGLPTARYYLRGWVNRVTSLYRFIKERR
jgi:lysozyme family protein